MTIMRTLPVASMIILVLLARDIARAQTVRLLAIRPRRAPRARA
jgi:hypothetical protein